MARVFMNQNDKVLFRHNNDIKSFLGLLTTTRERMGLREREEIWWYSTRERELEIPNWRYSKEPVWKQGWWCASQELADVRNSKAAITCCCLQMSAYAVHRKHASAWMLCTPNGSLVLKVWSPDWCYRTVVEPLDGAQLEVIRSFKGILKTQTPPLSLSWPLWGEQDILPLICATRSCVSLAP